MSGVLPVSLLVAQCLFLLQCNASHPSRERSRGDQRIDNKQGVNDNKEKLAMILKEGETVAAKREKNPYFALLSFFLSPDLRRVRQGAPLPAAVPLPRPRATPLLLIPLTPLTPLTLALPLPAAEENVGIPDVNDEAGEEEEEAAAAAAADAPRPPLDTVAIVVGRALVPRTNTSANKNRLLSSNEPGTRGGTRARERERDHAPPKNEQK